MKSYIRNVIILTFIGRVNISFSHLLSFIYEQLYNSNLQFQWCSSQPFSFVQDSHPHKKKKKKTFWLRFCHCYEGCLIDSNVQPQAGHNIRSIFKQRWVEFRVFLLLGWLPNQSKILSALLFTHSGEERKMGTCFFPRAIAQSEHKQSQPGFELWSPIPFPAIASITQIAPP